MGITAFTTARDRLVAGTSESLTGEEACALIVDAFGLVAPAHAVAVLTTDPETNLPAGGVVRGFDTDQCIPFWDNELLDPDFNKFNALARSIDPVATLADATDGDLGRSPRHVKLYEAAGGSDELRVAITSGTTCLAIGAFVRCDGEVYSTTEVRDVRNLLVPAANLLRSALGQMSDPLTSQGPVVVLLDAGCNIVSQSEDAEAVLADLRVSVDEVLPATIHVAASRVRRSRSSSRFTTRLRGTSGRWVRIHVTPMAGDDGIVSVMIDGARAGDLVPILLDSYGLTDRESDIVLLVCRGTGTKEIASELSISVHTVRDHLKSIFEKSGVSSRGELVARLFSNHLLELFEDNVTHV